MTPRCDALAKTDSPDWEKAAREFEKELSHAYLLVAENIEGHFLACNKCFKRLEFPANEDVAKCAGCGQYWTAAMLNGIK
jgi:hypothetical protein